jgi:hypothetical protein
LKGRQERDKAKEESERGRVAINDKRRKTDQKALGGRTKRRTTARDIGDGFRVGCHCRFIVVRYGPLPNLVEIRVVEEQHSNHCGASCRSAKCVHFPNGVDGRSSIEKLAALPPRLSGGCLSFVRALLAQSTETTNQEIKRKVREWCGAGGSLLDSEVARAQHVHTRNMAITFKDIQNIRRKVKKVTYQLANDLALSVRLFVEREAQHVFLYQQAVQSITEEAERQRKEKETTGVETAGKVEQLQTFHLGLCTPWQRGLLERHGRTVCLDSTFRVNDKAFPLFTAMVIDGHWHGVPVAWDLMSGQSAEDIALMLRSLKAHCPGWRPEVFIVDDCQAENTAIRQVEVPNICINVLCEFLTMTLSIKNCVSVVLSKGLYVDMLYIQPLELFWFTICFFAIVVSKIACWFHKTSPPC